MQAFSVQQAQCHLSEIIANLTPGEKLVILQDRQPVVRLVGESPCKIQLVPGRCEGLLTGVTEDAEHLEDWAEYQP